MDSRIKGQASMEVVLLVGFLFAVFVVFIAFVNGQLTDKRAEIELQLLEDVSKKVQGEINIAYNVKDGYSRNFSLPLTLDGSTIDYSIQIWQNNFIANTSTHQYNLAIPTITGSIKKGVNVIRKSNGTVFIN